MNDTWAISDSYARMIWLILERYQNDSSIRIVTMFNSLSRCFIAEPCLLFEILSPHAVFYVSL